MKLRILTIIGCLLLCLSGCASSSKTVKLNLSDPTVYDTYFTKAFNQHPDVCYDAISRVSGRVDLGDAMQADKTQRKIVTSRFNPLMKTMGVESVMGQKAELQYEFNVYGDEQSCVMRMNNIHIWINDVEQTTYNYVEREDSNWATEYLKEMDTINQEAGRTAPKSQEIPLSSISYSYK